MSHQWVFILAIKHWSFFTPEGTFVVTSLGRRALHAPWKMLAALTTCQRACKERQLTGLPLYTFSAMGLVKADTSISACSPAESPEIMVPLGHLGRVLNIQKMTLRDWSGAWESVFE